MKYNKTAIIFGITGQDGSYLSNYLLKKKYKVIGITRNKQTENIKTICVIHVIRLPIRPIANRLVSEVIFLTKNEGFFSKKKI